MIFQLLAIKAVWLRTVFYSKQYLFLAIAQNSKISHRFYYV